MNIAANITKIKNSLPREVRLVAVSKTKPNEDILEAYNAGHKIFGENKVQELMQKYEQLPKDIEWHFIGHLQTNKVKYIAPFVHLIHSLDSEKLLFEINKEAFKNRKVINCLLQFHIASEETKFGLNIEEAYHLIKTYLHVNNPYLRITGVMGMASLSDDQQLIRGEFQTLKSYFDKIKMDYFKDFDYFKEISMGMSGDFRIAIEEGSTMVRIGTLIFGERNY